MKLFQFLAHTANQVGRFAPEAEVPEEWAQLLTELGSVSRLQDVDAPLVEPFTTLLGDAYREILSKAVAEVTDTVRVRIAVLADAKKAAEQKFAEEHAAANRRAVEAAQRVEDDRQMLQEHKAKIAELENRIAALSK